MTTNLTKEDVLAFCQASSWAFQVWSIHRGFQDNLPTDSEFVRKHADFFRRLSSITQEYTLQQIAKLNDPTKQAGEVNLSISFIIERGDWDQGTRATLDQMCSELRTLAERLRSARNKILAHNDRNTALAAHTLGEFPEGMDDRYFETLQEFVNVVHANRIGGPYPFDDLARADTEVFIEALSCLPPRGPNKRLQPPADAE